MTTHVCGCGKCGITFTLERPLRGRQRKYASNCPLISERKYLARRKASQVTYARRLEANPRKCHCGCGRELPRYLRFHPECETRTGRERDRAPDPAKVPGKKRRCTECSDQCWRRDPKYGCLQCNLPYAPERVKPKEVTLGCSLAHIPG